MYTIKGNGPQTLYKTVLISFKEKKNPTIPYMKKKINTKVKLTFNLPSPFSTYFRI